MRQDTSLSRRLSSRGGVPEDTWVFWQCRGREDISLIRDLSLGGLFIETSSQLPANAEANLHFLVQEGEISAKALVRHARPGSGLGLKFISLHEKHHRPLASLLNRLRSLSNPAQK